VDIYVENYAMMGNVLITMRRDVEKNAGKSGKIANISV
jgi:hypothetical protein